MARARKARFMSKLPENRRPYDPAKAARDRAAALSERPTVALTADQLRGRRPLLRPEPPRNEDSRTEDSLSQQVASQPASKD
jgi:hypothetical protein